MKRTDHVQQVLSAFQLSHPDVPVLAIETVWSHSWTQQRYEQYANEAQWKKAAGVYIFLDYCPQVDWEWNDERLADDERFSIIRRIGKAVNIGKRYSVYDSRWGDNGRVCWTFDTKKGVYWFRYTQLDIIRLDRNLGLEFELEQFLLQRIGTTDNPPPIAGLKPIRYDEES